MQADRAFELKKDKLSIIKGPKCTEAYVIEEEDSSEGGNGFGSVQGQGTMFSQRGRDASQSSLKSSQQSKTNNQESRIWAPLEYQKRQAATMHKPNPSKGKEKVEATISEMLAAVRDLWFELDDGRGVLELECNRVARKLCSAFQAFPDHSTAQKYIWNVIQAKKNLLSWDDFNSIFSKGIFKETLINKAQSLSKGAGPSNRDSEKLGEKLSRSKRNNLQEQLKEGMIMSADQKT